MRTIDVIFDGHSVKESGSLFTVEFRLDVAAPRDIVILVTTKDDLATGMLVLWSKHTVPTFFL